MPIEGDLAATESGPDICSVDATVVPGSDVFLGYGYVPIEVTMTTYPTENPP